MQTYPGFHRAHGRGRQCRFEPSLNNQRRLYRFLRIKEPATPAIPGGIDHPTTGLTNDFIDDLVKRSLDGLGQSRPPSRLIPPKPRIIVKRGRITDINKQSGDDLRIGCRWHSR